MSQNYTYPPGFATSVNPSVGLNGSSAPLSSTQVGGKNPSNDLEPLLVDAAGNLLVNVTNTGGTPVNTQDAADGPVTPGTVAGKSILIGAQFNTSLPTLSNSQQAALQSDSSARLIIAPLTNSSIIKAQLQDNAGTAITLGQKTSAASLPVVLASDQSTIVISGTVAATQSGNWSTRTLDGSGNSISSTGGALNVNLLTSSITLNVSASQSGTWNINNITGTVSLPTGAATETTLSTVATNTTGLNNTITTSGSAFPTSALQIGVRNGSNLVAITEGSTTSANSLPVVIASDQAAVAVKGSLSPTTGRSVANAPIQNIYSSVNITTAAYTQLVASTTSTINYIDIFDSSGQAMIFAVGAAASEVIQAYISPGGDQIPLAIPAGSRIAYKALSANATTGYLIMSFYT